MIRRPPRSTLFPLHDALPISLSDVPPGTVVLKVTRIGFGPQTRSVTVAAGASAEARFALTPQASLLEAVVVTRSEEHTSELQSRLHLVCRLLLEKKKKKINYTDNSNVKHHHEHKPIIDTCTLDKSTTRLPSAI